MGNESIRRISATGDLVILGHEMFHEGANMLFWNSVSPTFALLLSLPPRASRSTVIVFIDHRYPHEVITTLFIAHREACQCCDALSAQHQRWVPQMSLGEIGRLVPVQPLDVSNSCSALLANTTELHCLCMGSAELLFFEELQNIIVAQHLDLWVAATSSTLLFWLSDDWLPSPAHRSRNLTRQRRQS